MSCPLSQSGGRPHYGLPPARKRGPAVTVGAKIPGTEKTLRNGAVGALYEASSGKPRFRIFEGPKVGMRVPPFQITPAIAKKRFDTYYARERLIRRGPHKGEYRYKSPSSRAWARTYDLNHTTKPYKVITDSRYLSPVGVATWDYQGVDTGKRVRKVGAKQAAHWKAFGEKWGGHNVRRAI